MKRILFLLSVVIVSTPHIASADTVEKKLNTAIAINLQDVPLEQVLNHLSKQSGIKIQLAGNKAKKFKNETVSIDIKRAIPLRSILSIMLEQYELEYEIEKDVINIVIQKEKSHLIRKTYNIFYLISLDPKARNLKMELQLMQLMIKTFSEVEETDQLTSRSSFWVNPLISDFNEAKAKISKDGKTIVVIASRESHEFLDDLLRQLKAIGDPVRKQWQKNKK